ncbi:MAG: Mrp/NBP35 family ATP-binding protein [Desulfobacterales bacterium]|nr:Mrp/NBP35 family ATP-binding protein [Desulfobacterales bacterium]
MPHRQDFYKGTGIKAIADNLRDVKHIIAVMSGKGGVGKSIISANLAIALADNGYSVAIMDSDLYGPSIPSILGIEDGHLLSGPKGIVPPQTSLGIKVVSMDFLLKNNGPITWLSDLKRSAQEIFLANIDYGHLDCLIIDMPPGTGSETVNLLKYLPQMTGVVMVTMSSDIAEQVVHRCITLCQKAAVPIIGLIENMSHLICPHCGKTYSIEQGSSDLLAQEVGVPLLGKIPRDQLIVEAADKGTSFLLEYPDSGATNNFLTIASKIEQITGGKLNNTVSETDQVPDKSKLLKIIEINYDHSCPGKSCLACTDYFQCTFPKKVSLSDFDIYKKIGDSMAGIKHKIAVMSCKGGVGKSTLSANLAVALAQEGKEAVILDCDFHGPCIPKILGVESVGLRYGKDGINPIQGAPNVGVVSMDFFIQQDEAVTWFDSLKKTTISQFLSGVDYGNLDYLIVDLPPGTGAESYGLLQCIPDLDGALIVTLPSESPQIVTRRSIGLCKQANVPVIGVIENMSHFVCAKCQNISKLCGTKESLNLADETGVPFLGNIPLDSNVFEGCNEGLPFVTRFPESIATHGIFAIADKIKGQLRAKVKANIFGPL